MDEDGKEYSLEPKEFQVLVSPFGMSDVQVSAKSTWYTDKGKRKLYLLGAGLGMVAAVLCAAGIVIVKRKEEDGEKQDESGQNNRN